jgi:hypothetical protein
MFVPLPEPDAAGPDAPIGYGLEGQPLYAPDELDEQLRALCEVLGPCGQETVPDAVSDLVHDPAGPDVWRALVPLVGHLQERQRRRGRLVARGEPGE